MAKFLDKKEQVIDFQLTPYGNYLLSTGIFKPVYYAFYDSNILYDKQYMRGTYCKSASCGQKEVFEIEFISDDRAEYSTMGLDSDGVYGPSQYLTVHNGSMPYNFWFLTSDADNPPGTGVLGIKPRINLKDISTESKEEFAFKFFKDINDGDTPFTANLATGGSVVFLTASVKGPSVDALQTISANVVTASVHVQGTEFEVFRALSDVPVENQNEIEKRIKDETQYLEGILCFTDLESEPSQRASKPLAPSTRFIYDARAIRENPNKDVFKFDSAIGDARFDNEKKQNAPAWKVVTLAGQISSSVTKDIKNQQLIPQINIDMMYSKEIKDMQFEFQDSSVAETIDTLAEINRTKAFPDKKTIALESEDLLLYTEEINSEFLSENFDIEVYEVLPERYDAAGVTIPGTERLKRKFFDSGTPQIVDGMMVRHSPRDSSAPTSYTTSSVEYYFDIYTDKSVDAKIACQGAEIFNKDSYYIDIDFECESQQADDLYYDIYGRATDPELCQT